MRHCLGNAALVSAAGNGLAEAGGVVAGWEPFAVGVVGGQAGNGVGGGGVVGAEPEDDDRGVDAPPGVVGLDAVTAGHAGDLCCRAGVVAELWYRVAAGVDR